MLNNHLSHLTYCQFFSVTFLLLIFSLCSISAFYIIYFNNKKKVIPLFSLLLIIIFLTLLIEISYIEESATYFIFVFRILSIILIFYFIFIKEYIGILIHILIIILSLTNHYVTIYSLLLPVVYYWFKYKPQKIDIIIETKASEILNELNEAIIICNSNNILLINPLMRKILNLEEIKDIHYISEKLFSDKYQLPSLLKKESKLKDYYIINSNFYKINLNRLKNQGLIITATDITEKINIQNEYKKSIIDLEKLTERLNKYATKSEEIGINKEKAQIYSTIEKIVQNGLNKLKDDLIKIKDAPPDSYQQILYESRTLLNEIRELVNNWRRIKGEMS